MDKWQKNSGSSTAVVITCRSDKVKFDIERDSDKLAVDLLLDSRPFLRRSTCQVPISQATLYLRSEESRTIVAACGYPIKNHNVR